MDKVFWLTVAEVIKGWMIGSVSGVIAILLLGTGNLNEFITFLVFGLAISFLVVYQINKKVYHSK
ncbi:hypothetical protein HYX07_03210 [Candidatus Woesearchaeota archaeon]|nr:hypothetical protein [Candidatus Woesearchaeota archaeon]